MADLKQELPCALFDALGIGLILIGQKQRVVLWNAWLAEMSGIPPSVAVGGTLPEIFPEAQQLEAAVAFALSSGVSSLLTHSLHPSLLPLRTRAGRTLVHDVRVSATEHDGEAACLVQLFDVTVSAERDRVLRERQNARYDAVVRSAPDAILTLDSDRTIQFANPSALRQFGYEENELVEAEDDTLFPGQRPWRETLCAVLAGRPSPQPVEVSARRKDGSTILLEASLAQWSTQSRVFVTAILRDISERRAIEEARKVAAQQLAELNATLEQRVLERTAQLMEAEEALRQSAKMEAVGQLTGGIAHDFNNLLQGILGSLDRVQRRIEEGRIGDVHRFLTGAVTSANRAVALTHRLLAFSRRQPVDPQPIDINELIASVGELLRRSIGEAVAMSVRSTRELWLVRCDANQLESALLNLAINARDAMPAGGVLTIQTSNRVIDAQSAARNEIQPGEYACVRVSDTGVGMAPDVRMRAFDPFYTTKPMGQGTGLGLSMIYGFIRQSDGAVTIESEVGEGTSIEILLPRFEGQIQSLVPDDAGAGEGHAGANEVVLVVEDESVVRLLIVELLNDLGYHALEAADGPSALRILQSLQRVDLLVSDIGLPGLNGRQLADAARVRRPNLRVLFMTGYAEKAAGKAFLAEGMEIVAKPFTMDVLAAKIRRMIEHAPRVDSGAAT